MMGQCNCIEPGIPCDWCVQDARIEMLEEQLADYKQQRDDLLAAVTHAIQVLVMNESNEPTVEIAGKILVDALARNKAQAIANAEDE